MAFMQNARGRISRFASRTGRKLKNFYKFKTGYARHRIQSLRAELAYDRVNRKSRRSRRRYSKKANFILIAVALGAAYLFRSQIGDAFEKIQLKFKKI